MIAYTVSLKPEVRSTIDRVDLAVTMRKLLPDCGLVRAMQYASQLLAGESLTVGQLEVVDVSMLTKSVIFDASRKVIMSPQEEREAEAQRERQLRDARFQRLLELGAKGDSIAAITYCKAVLAGEISHAAYAGAC